MVENINESLGRYIFSGFFFAVLNVFCRQTEIHLTSTAEMNGKKWIARTFLSYLSVDDVMDRSFWIIAEAVAVVEIGSQHGLIQYKK